MRIGASHYRQSSVTSEPSRCMSQCMRAMCTCCAVNGVVQHSNLRWSVPLCCTSHVCLSWSLLCFFSKNAIAAVYTVTASLYCLSARNASACARAADRDRDREREEDNDAFFLLIADSRAPVLCWNAWLAVLVSSPWSTIHRKNRNRREHAHVYSHRIHVSQIYRCASLSFECATEQSSHMINITHLDSRIDYLSEVI